MPIAFLGVDDRRAKLERLREQGIDPFPHEFDGVVPISEVHAAHHGLEAGEETASAYRIAGRMTGRRGHGGAAFIDVVDRSGKLQVHAKRDVLGEEQFDTLTSLDLGDLIGIDGTAFKSRRGELSLRAEGWTLLAKSLRAPPEKFHGLEDVETRYRHREVDLLANEETRELFILRSKVVRAVRRWLDERGFLEVETPILQPLYGGALARPFVTHHNALDRDVFLRVAYELYLKRLIVGGLERVYEIGKDFRNEGISHKHNPEFTMLEWYEAYADYRDIAARLEELIAYVAADVGYDGPIDFSTPWKRLTLREAILEKTGIDIAGDDELPGEGTWGKRVDDLLSQHVEPDLQDPDVHPRLPQGALTLRQGPPLRAGAGGALRVLCRRDGVRKRLHGAERPGRAARALRAAGPRPGRGRRRDPALRRGLRARARARHAPDRRNRNRNRPPGDDPERTPLDPRGRAVSRHARQSRWRLSPRLASAATRRRRL